MFRKEATSVFTVMRLVTQHQTSPGQKVAAQQCRIKERSTALLTYRDRLLEITHVQLGMEWVNSKMLQLQLLCIVSCLYRCSFAIAFYFSPSFCTVLLLFKLACFLFSFCAISVDEIVTCCVENFRR